MISILFNAKCKTGLLVIGLLYGYFYNRIYMDFVFEYFAYMVGDCIEKNITIYVFYLICAAVPLMFYKGFINIASLFSFFTYLLIYVPMIEALYVTTGIDLNVCVINLFLLAICMCLFFATDNVFLLKKPFLNNSIRKGLPFSFVEWATVLIFIYLILVQHSQMTFVNFFADSELMYDLREDTVSGTATNYLLNWEKNALIPICIVYYLCTKKHTKYVMAIVMSFIMFMLDYQKLTFFMPFIITVMYYLIIKLRFLLPYIHSTLIGLFIIVPYCLIQAITSTDSLVFLLASTFVMRTQCVATWLFSMYLRFFENHPLTYFSHINIVNAITQSYPYKEVLGRAVSSGMNANANFLITDGYAAMKGCGIVIIAVIFIFVKSVVNSIGLKYNYTAVLIILLPVISAMLNVSLFTTIFSFGLLIIYLIFLKVDLYKIK